MNLSELEKLESAYKAATVAAEQASAAEDLARTAFRKAIEDRRAAWDRVGDLRAELDKAKNRKEPR